MKRKHGRGSGKTEKEMKRNRKKKTGLERKIEKNRHVKGEKEKKEGNDTVIDRRGRKKIQRRKRKKKKEERE